MKFVEMKILKSLNLMNHSSDNYGQVVNLARMMLSESDTTNYSVYDNCREALIYRENNSKMPQEVDIYPNPTDGNLTVDLPISWESGTMEIYGISGILVKKVFIEKKNKIDIQLKLNYGTYFIKLNSIDGEFSVKKFVVIK